MAVVRSGETQAGALRFHAGAGRHGDFGVDTRVDQEAP
jgi:hypothetical protein